MKKTLIIIAAFTCSSLLAEPVTVNLLEGFFNKKSQITFHKRNTSPCKVANGILKFSLSGDTPRMHLNSAGFKVESKKKYLASCDIKITDFKSLNAKAYCIFYIYNFGNNAHTWLRINGSGSTSDFITMLLPFEADKLLKQSNTKLNFMVNIKDCIGTFELKNLNLIEIPVNSDMQRSFILSDGKTISLNCYTIK